MPTACHFTLLATPENPNPRYKARDLGLVCVTGGQWGDGSSLLTWEDGDSVLTEQD